MTASGPCDGVAVTRLLSQPAARGWRQAVRSACDASPELLRYATDPREGDVLHLLPAVETRRALFLGNALAMLPFILAELFEDVVIADWNAGRLAFARQREQEEAVANVTCIAAEAVEGMAARDGGFDVVVLGEECPEAPTSLPFAGSWTPQRLSSLVVDAGCLMYGVRFRLVDAVPRRLARPWGRSTAVFYPAHARLLAAAGLSPVATYWRRPDTRPYQAYIPLASPSIVGYWLAQAHRPRGVRARATAALTRLAHRAGGLLHLIDNFIVIARRPS